MPEPVTRAEQTGWQRQATTLLTSLLELAARQDLPPITWTVGSAGASVGGHVLSRSARREHYAAWKAALNDAIGRDPDRDHEHTFTGETRLVCGWNHVPVGMCFHTHRVPRTANISLACSVFDEEESTDA